MIVAAVALSACSLLQVEKTEEINLNSADIILDKIIFEEATAALDSSRCNEIITSDISKECIYVINAMVQKEKALETEDLSECESIELPRYKENCINALNTILQEHVAALEEQENIELSAKAFIEGDSSACDDISDESQRNTCLYNIFVNKAKNDQDESLCNEIEKEQLVNKCKEKFRKKDTSTYDETNKQLPPANL